MQKPLISVIVPVYKAQAYLEQCVRSIQNQTYQNLEILLVDDGSPDRSGQMCDELAKTDPRIVVLHQENAGLSGARNSALQIAKGEYLGFVDSDDYIELDMFEYLYDRLTEVEADISVCAFRKYDLEKGPLEPENEERLQVWANAQAMEKLLEDQDCGSHACNKLFKKELWDEIYFPVGRVYEDVAVMHRVFARANRVVSSSAMKYHYLIHQSSISYTPTARWGYGLYRAFYERYRFIDANYPQYAFSALEKAIGMATGMYLHWQRFRKTDEIRDYEKEVRQFLKQNRKSISQCKNLSKRRRSDAKRIVRFPCIVKLKYQLYYTLKRG